MSLPEPQKAASASDVTVPTKVVMLDEHGRPYLNKGNGESSDTGSCTSSTCTALRKALIEWLTHHNLKSTTDKKVDDNCDISSIPYAAMPIKNQWKRWVNHMSGFARQEVELVMTTYDEKSHRQTSSNVKGSITELHHIYHGIAGITAELLDSVEYLTQIDGKHTVHRIEQGTPVKLVAYKSTDQRTVKFHHRISAPQNFRYNLPLQSPLAAGLSSAEKEQVSVGFCLVVFADK